MTRFSGLTPTVRGRLPNDSTGDDWLERTEIRSPIDACSKLHCIKRCRCRDLSLQPSPLPFFAHVLFFSSCSSSLTNFSAHILTFLLHFALLAWFFCFLLEDKVRQYKSRNIGFRVHGLSQPPARLSPTTAAGCTHGTGWLRWTAFTCLLFLASHTTLSLVSPPHYTAPQRRPNIPYTLSSTLLNTIRGSYYSNELLL